MKSPLFTNTVTVLNHYRRQREDLWQATVLSGVQVRCVVKSVLNTTGQWVTEMETQITIPADADAGGRRYGKPAAFLQADETERSGLWTLDPVNGMDLILPEPYTGDMVDAQILSDLQREGAVTVMAVSDNTLRPRLKHWKVRCI